MEDTVPEHVTEYVLQLLDVGDRLARLVDGLSEALAAGAGLEEDEATGEILSLVVGTVSERLSSTPRADFECAAALMPQTLSVVLADLQNAMQVAQMAELETERML